ncbi:MAG: hypothetical protein D6722_11470 [Bacteroidetes bacterium]|nr:MAG: hypothetical protein D6722_11470 [Bacteroidota bacterium]
MRYLIFWGISLWGLSLQGQAVWQVHLLNPSDSTAVPFARLQWWPDGAGAFTNLDGQARLPLPEKAGPTTLQIKAIGYDSLWQVQPRSGDIDTLWVPQGATSLEPVQLEGLTAREVVRRALASVSMTFADSSYAAYGFYRSFDEINGQYANLIELEGILLMLLQVQGSTLQAREALAVAALHRSPRWDPVPNPGERDFMELMWHNPVYHRRLSSLSPAWMNACTFDFDTITATHFRVHYVLAGYSSDNHGITSQEENPFQGEADEEGWLMIEREGLGIQSYERKTIRNPGFVYRQNNFVKPGNRFRAELVEGQLRCDFIKLNGRWYLSRLQRQYTNEYQAVFPQLKTYQIRSVFEWTSQYVTHERPQDPELVFDFQPQLRTLTTPKRVLSQTLPPIYGGDAERLYQEVGAWE